MGSLGSEVGHGGREMFHGHPDPVVDELNRLENLLREKERELGLAYSEIKGMKVTEALKDKAIAELSKELKKQDEKLSILEKQLEQKNLDVKRLCNERKEALSAQFAAEASLRRIHSAQREEEVVPFDAIIGPLESDIKKYKHEIAVLQDDKKALERHLKLNEAAFAEAGDILRSALERALIVEDVQNQNIELKKQMEIYHEENMLLEKSNRQKVLEIEKLTHTVGELEESILTTRDVANAVHFYQNQATRLNEEKKTLERELARAKVYVNRVATTTANEWKDDADKLMPVKRWLEERRLLQGEIQRLRDKIAIAERSAKVEAQLNDKLKRRLKSLEEDMRNGKPNAPSIETNRKSTLKRSTSQPRQPSTPRMSQQLASFEGIVDKRRPISQPRVATAGKVLRQPNSDTEPAEKARNVKQPGSPRARTAAARKDRPVKNHLWATSKVTSDAGKENKEQNPNYKPHSSAPHVEEHDSTKPQAVVFDVNGDCGVQCSEHHKAMDLENLDDEKVDASNAESTQGGNRGN
ncbi:microtubule-associated protein 70-4-like [Hordeum vulgare subsp. vulgare]|uniref:Predicted protein n=1 Tax=Hordeum vulgare subsp. vulgare TaxID=112509 RepID=F2EBW4_HORVV|nr:microtubule-associated protein 70-4-like [Hordeum vulgare subsp. vulgare]KAI4993340.1 hypothetical protein ZWY2020_007653 [Hordeum vulgare]BAK04836.1 predicted protein [Hordeum vulgare subsp. vulgare]